MPNLFLRFYRQLPAFKGKLSLGRILFKKLINQDTPIQLKAHQQIKYNIPNTIESLGVELLFNGIYEKDMVAFLQNHLKPGDIYFDIGANIGALGMPVIKKKKNVKYFGFEASPTTFEYLKLNFQQNNFHHYELHNNLVYECDNFSTKFYETDKYGEGSLAPTFTDHYVFVNSVTLDTFCIERNLTRINLMKVDVQGFELSVFKGMKQLLLNKKVDNILFEFEHWAEEWAGVEKGAAQQFLLDMGYHLFDIKGKRLTEIVVFGQTMIWARPA
ncbi:MAG: Methyltransferase FkbM [Ferruginibacter sp.]|uniref:FkbM family methyltransferase n=1 Tax=Ferruginibacter sp. TaxID=1940288 RepID=UPI00265A848E|nr:FkbM family methyltransferase [Ferruginibacter sp.]MDB5280372.1 Methyltransferase FkbM [Ferruginibacter sp.]